MKVGAVSFAVGSGRLVRRAGSVLFDATGTNNELVAGFDSAASDGEAIEFTKAAVAASGLSLGPFTVVRWGDAVDLLAFGDVAIHTSTAIAPMISGASSTTWVEHRLTADYVQSEGSIGVWSGAESEAGTNLRLGVAACGGFRCDLVPSRSDGGSDDNESGQLADPFAEPEFAEPELDEPELAEPEFAEPELDEPERAESELDEPEPSTYDAMVPSGRALEDSGTADLVGFEAVQVIANDLPSPEVSDMPSAPPAEPSSEADDHGDFFGSFEPRTRTSPEHTAVQAGPPVLDALWIDDEALDDEPLDDVAAEPVLAEPVRAEPVVVESVDNDDFDDDMSARVSSPLPPDFTESKMLVESETAGVEPAERPAPALCEKGHSNPADSSSCFTCGGEIVANAGSAEGQPTSGWLKFDDGSEVAVDRMLIIGRKPATFDDHAQAVVIDHPEVSRSHAQVEVQGWAVVLTDLGSRNGTWVSMPGAEPERLDAGEPRVLETGAVVLLGAPDASFSYQIDRT